MILVTGASGFLGAHVARAVVARGLGLCAWRGVHAAPPGIEAESVELLDERATAGALERVRPTAVIHCAAEARVAACAADPGRAFALNAGASLRLAEIARDHGARFLLVSTDMVFDGEHAPYAEDAATAPTSVYGRSKVEAERAVLALGGDVLVARVPLLFGDSLTARVSAHQALRAELLAGRAVRLFNDEVRTPLEVGEAAEGLVTLALSTARGVVHRPGPARLSRLDLGRALCREIGAREDLLVPTSRLTAPGEPRPRDLSLVSTR